MSWDVSVFASTEIPPPVLKMSDKWRGEILGTQDEVRRKISECLPKVNWSDPTWGILDGEGFSFEFNIGKEDPSKDFMVHVRGGGEAVPPLLRLAERWNWYLLDLSQGEWLHHCSENDAGWKQFQAYRDRMLGK